MVIRGTIPCTWFCTTAMIYFVSRLNIQVPGAQERLNDPNNPYTVDQFKYVDQSARFARTAQCTPTGVRQTSPPTATSFSGCRPREVFSMESLVFLKQPRETWGHRQASLETPPFRVLSDIIG